MYYAQRMIGALGPAINSGRALLLYGGAGSGKTFVATKLLNSLNTSVYIPYAVFAAGNIIKCFHLNTTKELMTTMSKPLLSKNIMIVVGHCVSVQVSK